MIKIKEIYGYILSYDEKRQFFVITDTDGTELAHSENQDGAETKAKVLSKQEFKRISIIEVEGQGSVRRGELTSLNKDDQSVWVSMEKSKHGWGSGRQKTNLRYSTGYYEATDTNLKILEGITAKRKVLDNIVAELESLKDTLEKPINLDYFGLKRDF